MNGKKESLNDDFALINGKYECINGKYEAKNAENESISLTFWSLRLGSFSAAEVAMPFVGRAWRLGFGDFPAWVLTLYSSSEIRPIFEVPIGSDAGLAGASPLHTGRSSSLCDT